jgi:D-sedoheptulose 7-phosphate isomerase
MKEISKFLECATQTIAQLNRNEIEAVVDVLNGCREKGGRLFCLGSGGGAGHASHATCDFRKLCNLEAYCPSDNVSELTARTNDEGWENSLSGYLKGSRLTANDCLMIFSVGGGSVEPPISMNLVKAAQYAQEVGASIVGVVGRDGGYTAKVANACVVIPTVSAELVTPLAEGFQALIWHLFVSHPKLQRNTAKWESTTPL